MRDWNSERVRATANNDNVDELPASVEISDYEDDKVATVMHFGL